MKFGDILKKLRLSKDLTQQQLADALFVDKTSVCKWEAGAYFPNQEMLFDIADFFGVTLDYLFNRKIANSQPEILDLYDELTPAQQQNLLNYARGMAVSNALDSEPATTKQKRA